MRTSSTALTILLVASLVLPVSSAWSEDATIADEDLMSWVLLLDEGGGAGENIDVGGRGIQVVRIPIAFELISQEKSRYGLRFNLPISFGFHELTVDTIQEGQIRENLSTVTILPGLEWLVPLPERGVVKPYFEVGLSSDLGSSNSAWIYSLGTRLLRPIGHGSKDLFFGARLQYSGSWIEEVGQSDTILTGEAGIERIFGLRQSIRGHGTSLGLYALVHYNFTKVKIREFDDSTTTLRRTALEVGVSIGTEGDLVIWGMRLPRIGLSYRSSGDFQSWRINFGFPF